MNQPFNHRNCVEYVRYAFSALDSIYFNNVLRWAKELNIDSMKCFIKIFKDIDYEVLLYSLQHLCKQVNYTTDIIPIQKLLILSGVNVDINIDVNWYDNRIVNWKNIGIITFIYLYQKQYSLAKLYTDIVQNII